MPPCAREWYSNQSFGPEWCLGVEDRSLHFVILENDWHYQSVSDVDVRDARARRRISVLDAV